MKGRKGEIATGEGGERGLNWGEGSGECPTLSLVERRERKDGG